MPAAAPELNGVAGDLGGGFGPACICSVCISHLCSLIGSGGNILEHMNCLPVTFLSLLCNLQLSQSHTELTGPDLVPSPEP